MLHATTVFAFALLTGCASSNPDLNEDQTVDGRDAGVFAQRVAQGDASADLNGDGAVDRLDLDVLIQSSGVEFEAPEFTVDRRAVVMLRVWNGSQDHPLGLANAYRKEDAPRRMAEGLQALHDEGWRRIWLLLPAGVPRTDAMKGSLKSWELRSHAWQDGMRAHVGEWIDRHPDTSVGVYMGLLKSGFAIPTSEELAGALQFWVDLGVSEIAADATSPPEYRDMLLDARRVLTARAVRVVMEAYPVVDGEVDREWLKRTPMMALDRFTKFRKNDPDSRWVFDPDRTEVIISVGGGRPVDVDELTMRLMQGYIPVIYSTKPEDRQEALATYAWFQRRFAPADD